MEPIRILQTGDFHLDSPFSSGRFSAEQSRQRRRDLRETFSAVMDLARSRKAQLLLLTGDLFEHHYVSIHTMRLIRDGCAAQPELQVFITPGNHDPAVADSFYHHLPWSPNVHIFRQGVMERVEMPELNLEVHGYGWTTWEKRESCLAGYTIADPSRFNLLVFHGDIDGSSSSPYCPVSRQEIAAAGFDVAAVGHIHQKQTHGWNDRVLAHYAGSPEPLDFGETGEHGVLWGEVTPEKQDWEFVPLARRRFETIPVEPECLLSPLRLEACLAQKNVALSQRLLLRVDAEGPRRPDQEGDVEELNYWLNQQVFYGEIRDRSYGDYDLEALEKEYEDTVLADFILEMKARMDRADSKECLRLQKALQLGLDALSGRRGEGQ